MADKDTRELHLPPRSATSGELHPPPQRATVPEADALEQGLPPSDADPELLDVEDETEIGFDVPEADAVEQRRPRAIPAAVSSRPIPFDAPEHDVLEQRLPAGEEDDDDDFR